MAYVEEDPNDPNMPVRKKAGQDNFTMQGLDLDGSTAPGGYQPSEPFSPVTPGGDPIDTSGNQPPQTFDPAQNPLGNGSGPEYPPPVDDNGILQPGSSELGPPTQDNGAGNPSLSSGIATALQSLISGNQTVSASDPQFAGALAANRLTNQRSQERGRQMLAERDSKEGVNNSGGFDSRLFGLEQQRGQNEQAFEGDLLNKGQNDRIQQIMQALQIAQGRENSNNELGFNYSQLEALLNSQAFRALLESGG